MQFLPPARRQFNGLGARTGRSGSNVTRDTPNTGLTARNRMRDAIISSDAGFTAPAKPSLNELLTDTATAFDAAMESEIAPLVNKFKKAILVNEARNDKKLNKPKFDEKGFWIGYEDVTPIPMNAEEIAYVNALTRASAWALKMLGDEINATKDSTDATAHARNVLAWAAYNRTFDTFNPSAIAKFAAFRNKRKNWESNLTSYSTEAIGIPDTVDSLSKLNTLVQKVQTAVDALDVGGYQARPLIRNLAARATQLGAKVTANEADDALVLSAESMALDELANAVTTATTMGKPGLASRLKAVYDRRKKAQDDADALAKDQEKKLQDVKDEAAAAEKKSKSLMIYGGVAAVVLVAYFAMRK